MSRETIDFGIDLGTTNSAIAVFDNGTTEIIKNEDNADFTPSVVGIGKHNDILVGLVARNRLGVDPDNTFAEFKLQMGSDHSYHVPRTDKTLTPEELSAEVLKALKGDVRKRKSIDLAAAVVTVPADFDSPEVQATQRAGDLAGLNPVPILQEPVAAALAYGFQEEDKKAFWFIYDLGGGTFDAAIMQIRDGMIQVVNHGGDKHLGGKLIDWQIVEQCFVPAIVKEYPLTNFERANPKWRRAFAKLKRHAEDAKVALSRDRSFNVLVDPLCTDDRGEPVVVDIDLQRDALTRIAEPFFVRSINICRQVLEEKRLGPGDIQNVLLVGGPTLMPSLREMLADPTAGLGIELRHDLDPIAAVARGAAIFARTQRLKRGVRRSAPAGAYSIDLEYKPVGSTTEPLVGGVITAPSGDLPPGLTIEFINPSGKPPWRSGKVEIQADGAFVINLFAAKGDTNRYRIELHDATGTALSVNPDTITYTVGLSVTEPPLPHSVGVAMANNETDVLVEKGTPLPTRQRDQHKQVYAVQKGSQTDAIRIPIVEGQNLRADRNRRIGEIVIPGSKLQRTIPAGAEVEITIAIDENRIYRVEAYIPVLDQEAEVVIDLVKRKPDIERLQSDFQRERDRLSELEAKVDTDGDSRATTAIDRVAQENMLDEIDTELNSARADRDAADKCERRLLDLKIALDQAEAAVEFPAAVREAEEQLAQAEKTIEACGRTSDRQLLTALKREVQAAIDAKDPVLLARKTKDVTALWVRLWWEQPQAWVGYLEYLETRRHLMSDDQVAQRLFDQGRRSIQNNDVDSLQAACMQLSNLLPPEEQEKAQGYGGTTIR